MIGRLKQLTLNLFAGANIVVVALMLAAGYSDHVSPERFPLLGVMGMLFPFFAVANLLFLFFWLLAAWRRAWLPIAGFVFAYVPITIYLPLNFSSAPPEGCIKVMSYNVCTYGGNYKYKQGFDTICSYIRRQKPDIVCLQEDYDSWRRYVWKRYSEFLAYNDTTVFCEKSQYSNAVGIHTRFPILRKERLPIRSEAHGAVAYYLKAGTDTLLVLVCHLEGTNLSKDDRTRYKDMLKGDLNRDTVRAESSYLMGKLGHQMGIRAPQADMVHDYLQAHARYPIIVCGDLNDTPISYTRRTVAKGLTDCFAASGRGLGLSYNQKGFTFRIDHIMCSSHFKPFGCYVDNKIDASDHYPMVCWLKKQENP